MRFSIIIPAHNAAAYIHKALESVKQQTFTDYELIVVCDNCSDNTAEIAKQYADKIEIVDYGRDGLARNRGIDLAQGEYILFMDDDDWWMHEYVLTMLDEKLKEILTIDILCFSFIFKHWKYATPTGNKGQHWIAVWNKCWRRKFIGNTRFPGRYSTSDVDFHNELFSKNPSVYDWDVLMYYYNYLRPGSISEKAKRGVPK